MICSEQLFFCVHLKYSLLLYLCSLCLGDDILKVATPFSGPGFSLEPYFVLVIKRSSLTEPFASLLLHPSGGTQTELLLKERVARMFYTVMECETI